MTMEALRLPESIHSSNNEIEFDSDSVFFSGRMRYQYQPYDATPERVSEDFSIFDWTYSFVVLVEIDPNFWP